MEPEKQTPPNPLHSLRTYQGDIEEILAKNKTSVASIVVEEQKRKEIILDLPKEKIHNDRRNAFFILLGALLFSIGVGANVWVYITKPSIEIPLVEQKSKTLIGFSNEKTMTVPENREEFVSALTAEKESFAGQPNDILYINITKNDNVPEDVAHIFQTLAPDMPIALSRAFENAYMFGIYAQDENEPFVILTTNDFGSSYSGMLAWEKDMPHDLAGLFDATNVATSTQFIDEAYRNKDLRILQNKERKTVLLYSFVDKNTLIITTHEGVFTGILGKYLVNKNIR